jgi:predicted ATPase
MPTIGPQRTGTFRRQSLEVGSDFSSDAKGLLTIAAICRHLDGIPLAIEFAAARAATLGLNRSPPHCAIALPC